MWSAWPETKTTRVTQFRITFKKFKTYTANGFICVIAILYSWIVIACRKYFVELIMLYACVNSNSVVHNI